MNTNKLIKSYSRHKWALCNYGILWSVHNTRRDAIKEAKETSGEEYRKYLQIFKVTISEGWK